MNAMEAILTRRSIRSFTGQDVEPEKVGQMLRAAMYAPSAHNSQDWSFIVVRDLQTRAALSRLTPYCGMITNAPVCIVVCGEPARQRAGRKEFFVQDCSAATQNLLLAAHALGLGAVWCGVYPNEAVVEKARSLLGVPVEVVPFALVAVGYAARTPAASERFRADLIHAEKW